MSVSQGVGSVLQVDAVWVSGVQAEDPRPLAGPPLPVRPMSIFLQPGDLEGRPVVEASVLHQGGVCPLVVGSVVPVLPQAGEDAVLCLPHVLLAAGGAEEEVHAVGVTGADSLADPAEVLGRLVACV